MGSNRNLQLLDELIQKYLVLFLLKVIYIYVNIIYAYI